MADSFFLVYLRLVQNVLCLLCKTVTVITLSRLIYLSVAQKHRVKCNLSNTLHVFIWCHLLNCIYSYTYHLYCVVGFSGVEARYNPYAMFWTGMGMQLYYGLSPIAFFFLTLERCLSLNASYGYAHRYKKLLLAAELVTLGACACIPLGYSLAELPLSEKTVSCMQFICLATKYHMEGNRFLKATFSALAFVVSMVFFFLLRTSSAVLNVNDRVVKVTIVVECVCCVIPSLAALLVPLISNIILSQYIGEYATTLLAVDGAITSCMLYRLLVRGRTVASSVTPLHHTSSS